jgi:excisionase family DNA binding protein
MAEGLDMSVHTSNRLTVIEIAERLAIGKMTVYDMLERGILPGIRLGKRWIITRHAYEQWERTCGTSPNMCRKTA